jgi:hypothetical protein
LMVLSTASYLFGEIDNFVDTAREARIASYTARFPCTLPAQPFSLASDRP